MKILGTYLDKDYYSHRVVYGAQIALEVISATADEYSGKADGKKWFVKIQSGCYTFDVLTEDGDYYDKDKADEIIRKIAIEDIVILDDIHMALFGATDITPDEYYVRNALDDDLNDIPLKVEN